MAGIVSVETTQPISCVLARLSDDPAVLSERARIARDLHDSVGQLLTGMGLRLADHLADAGDERTRQWLSDLHQLVGRADRELREAIEGLLFEGPRRDGLEAAVGQLCREVEQSGGLAVEFDVRGAPAPLTAEAEEALYRVAHEALLNVCHHAQATKAVVTLSYLAHSTSLSVRDNGNGKAGHVQLGRPGHFGVRTMRRRVEHAGGALRIRPVTPHGVVVEAAIPGRKVTAHAAGKGGGHR